MAYDTNSVRTSKLPYRILKEITVDEIEDQGKIEAKISSKGSYSSEIAEKLGIDQSLVSEIIVKLEELNLIKKGKRTRAQYYTVDPTGIALFSINQLYSDLLDSEVDPNYPDLEETPYDSVKEIVDYIEDYKEEIAGTEKEEALVGFVFHFCVHYLVNYEDSTIDTMVLKDLPSGVKTYSRNTYVYDWYNWLYDLCNLSRGTKEPGYIANLAFEDLENNQIIDLEEDVESLVDNTNKEN